MKKAELLSLALAGAVLVGCAPADPADELLVLSGSVEGWRHGPDGSLLVRVSTEAPPPSDVALAASAPLSPDGAFRVTLPGSKTLASLGAARSALIDMFWAPNPPAGCVTTTPLRIRPVGHSVIYTRLRARTATGEESDLELRAGSAADRTTATYMFSATDGTVDSEGSCSEPGRRSHGRTRVDLTRGWNVIFTRTRRSVTPDGVAEIEHESFTGAAPSDLRWQPTS